MALPLSKEIDLENAPSVADLKEKVKQGILRAMWLRAALLGANDGLLSTASLMLGIGAASSDKKTMIISGIAGGLAGACSMAFGEFVSVSTQRDIEKTMVEVSGLETTITKPQIPTAPIKLPPAGDHNSPTSVLSPSTMNYIASEDDEKEMDTVEKSVEAHTTKPSTVEESGLPTAPNKLPPAGGQNSPTRVLSPSRSSTMKCKDSETRLTALQDDTKEVDALPNPYQAAAASALSFLCGSFIPIVSTIAISSSKFRVIIIPIITSIALVAFGGIGALLGGSPVRVSAMRALIGGWISMAISYGLLKAFDQ